MNKKEAKSMHRWSPDSINLQIMVTDSSLAWEWMLILPFLLLPSPPLCFEVVLLEKSGCQDCWAWINFKNLQRFAVPVSFRMFGLIHVELSNTFQTLTDEEPISWPKTSSVVTGDRGANSFIISMKKMRWGCVSGVQLFSNSVVCR